MPTTRRALRWDAMATSGSTRRGRRRARTVGHLWVSLFVLATVGACDVDGAGPATQAVATTATVLAGAGTSLPSGVPTLVRDERWLMQTLGLIERHAYYSDRIDWPARYREAREFVASALGPGHLATFVSVVFEDLGDNHSRLLGPRAAEELMTTGPPRDVVGPSGEVFDGGVGYLLLPGFSGGAQRQGDRIALGETSAVSSYVNSARQLLASPEVCGWVIDLRRNTGGNGSPMLSAVAPLLGTGVFVGFQQRDGTLSGVELSEDGSVREVNDVALLGPKPGSPPAQVSLPVAVVTGAATASAGELVAIAFEGRPHRRSFGSPTAGLPTANDGFFLPDGSLLLLTVAVDVDRNGKTYDSPIAPR